MTAARQRWAMAGLTLLAILLAFTVDRPIARALSGLDPEVLNIARTVTWFGQGGVVLYPTGVLILTGLAIRFLRPGSAAFLDGPLRVIAAIFITVAAAGLADDALKIIFGRARPPLWLAGDVSGFGFFRFGSKFASFPSGHTTTSVAAALAFSALAPRAWPLFFLAAAAIAASRIVLGVHYLSDVIAGAALGAYVAVFVLNRLRRKGWLPDSPTAGSPFPPR